MPRALSAIMFFPRGGSAHVARALAANLPAVGWDVTLVSGSRRDQGDECDAAAFYENADVRPVDFTAALSAPDPTRHAPAAGEAPMHPSFEDRPDAPDAVFASLDDAAFELHVEAWARALERAGAAEAQVLHLHHLTPINEAARRVAVGVPVVGQLHGTELLMLERIAAGPPPSWRHAERWRDRLRHWARGCARLLVAPAGVERAVELLGVERERIVTLPNGFDPEVFAPRTLDRAGFWRRRLVDEPRGWLPGGSPGSAGYSEHEIRPLVDGVALLYVGRFTEVKRLPMLIRAFRAASDELEEPAGLVLVGGHPGEWEGPHPAEVIAQVEARDVYLAGWYGQRDLPEFLSAADAFLMASAREQFGQVLVEAMACGIPPVAAASLGPSLIVDDGETGWLVPLEDEAAMAKAIVAVVNDSGERRRRGRRAREVALERYSWPQIAGRAAEVFDAATGSAVEAPE